MRLLVISGFWPTRVNPITGIFIKHQVEAYAALGCHVKVIIPQIFRGHSRSRPLFQRAKGVDVWSPLYMDIPQTLSGGKFAVEFNTRSCAAAIKSTLHRAGISKRFDGIHVHGLRYSGFSLPYWSQALEGPRVFTLHGVDPFVKSRLDLGWFKIRLRRLWKHIDTITLVGAPLGEYARRLQVFEHQSRVIANGANIPVNWNHVQRSKDRRRVVLSVSNLTKLKGIDLNIRALAAIAQEHPRLDWEYRIVGDGPERSNLQRLTDELGISSSVFFLGRLAHEQTMREMADCDVFSLPSWGEAFGIVYVEVMGRGRPVIGCRHWGAEEVVRHRQDGLLVEPKDLNTLKEALHILLSNPDLCQRFGENARERAELFTWEANASHYIKLFKVLRNGRDGMSHLAYSREKPAEAPG